MRRSSTGVNTGTIIHRKKVSWKKANCKECLYFNDNKCKFGYSLKDGKCQAYVHSIDKVPKAKRTSKSKNKEFIFIGGK